MNSNLFASYFALFQPQQLHEWCSGNDPLTVRNCTKLCVEFNWKYFLDEYEETRSLEYEEIGKCINVDVDTDREYWEFDVTYLNCCEIRNLLKSIARDHGTIVDYEKIHNVVDNEILDVDILPEDLTNDDLNHIVNLYNLINAETPPPVTPARIVIDLTDDN